MRSPSLRSLLLAVATLLALTSLCSAARWTPLSTATPPYPSTTHPLQPSSHWAPGIARPLPTCEWWQNIALEPSNQPIVISPLSVRIETQDQLNFRPYNRTAEYESCHTTRTGTHCPSWKTARDLNAAESLPNGFKRGANFGLALPKHVASDIVATHFMPGFTFSAVEDLAPHQVTRWDMLSVNVRFAAAGSQHLESAPLEGPDRLDLPLVRGMPYATGVYTGLTPYLSTLNAILSVNEQDLPGTVQGSKLRMKINNGQVVLLYAWKNVAGLEEPPVGSPLDDDAPQWKWDRNTLAMSGSAARGDWVVRIAFLASESSPMETAYDKFAETYPLAGNFDYQFADQSAEEESEGLLGESTLSTLIEWTVSSRFGRLECERGLCFNTPVPNAAPLAMFSLPHQQSTFVGPSYVPDLVLDSVKGEMRAVMGSRWLMSTPAVPTLYTTFRAPREIDPPRLPDIRSQLQSDIVSSATAGEPDPYGFGKSISKIGRMLLMAEEVGLPQSTLNSLIAKMKSLLAPWLQAQNANALLYDSTYGGIVSTNGLKDQGADFGQAYYNDHHFHYGYILYGCAVLARFDTNWGTTYRESIYSLARDYANPSLDDAHFPRLRQFDAYDGHSWAAGLFVFADGRNQESSSEAINGYYALMLLGEVFRDSNLRDLGRMLTTMEIQGATTYWHSREGKSVYPDVFAKNKCIGMMWSDKAVEATWFAAGMTYIHGINMLPFTPISELYLLKPWVQEEYPFVWSTLTPDITDEWRGFLIGTRCVSEPNEAWKQIRALTSFDGGNTRSNLMYFCATRPVSSSTAENKQPQSQTKDEKLPREVARLIDPIIADVAIE